MTNTKVIENKLSLLRGYLKILEDFQAYSLEEIKKDVTIKGALERYLYLVVQSTIDLGEAIIGVKAFRKPTTYGEVFLILSENKIVDPELAENLRKMVGFRNIIAHAYERVDMEVVYKILHNGLEDIGSFISRIEKNLT